MMSGHQVVVGCLAAHKQPLRESQKVPGNQESNVLRDLTGCQRVSESFCVDTSATCDCNNTSRFFHQPELISAKEPDNPSVLLL